MLFSLAYLLLSVNLEMGILCYSYAVLSWFFLIKNIV